MEKQIERLIAIIRKWPENITATENYAALAYSTPQRIEPKYSSFTFFNKELTVRVKQGLQMYFMDVLYLNVLN